jgi:non-heme chloroperoxidase
MSGTEAPKPPRPCEGKAGGSASSGVRDPPRPPPAAFTSAAAADKRADAFGVPGRREWLGALALGAGLMGSGAARALAAALEAADGAAERFARREVVTSDGVRLNMIEQHPAMPSMGAPTIVLVPGWCMPATIWRAQLIDLGARWPTCALDPRGQGQSEIPPAGYTADRRADDLHDALQGRDRVVLVAWSLGVLEALQYVHRHGSGRLLGLALVDNSIGEPPAPAGSTFLQRLRKARAPTVDAFVRSMFAHPPPATTLEQLRASAMRMPLESSIALLSWPLPREHWRDVVHSFDKPLAYIVTPHLREQSEHLRRARPGSRIEVFEQAGHALFVDEALRFNRLLADWIATLA